MLEKLYEAEAALPELLRDERAWTGVYADAEKPVLRRLWRQWGDHRIYLHAFDPCLPEESFAHPHPWSGIAIRVVDGRYEMTVGASADPSVVPPTVVTMIFEPGSVYEMVHPHGFHGTRPIGGPTYSLMVAGPPTWQENRVRGNTIVRPLTPEERAHLFAVFRARYATRSPFEGFRRHCHGLIGEDID